jgi:excisionase family DNA binding protein
MRGLIMPKRQHHALSTKAVHSPHQHTLELLLNVPEAAKVLGVSPWTLRQWLSQRQLPFIKIGRLTKLRPSDLQSFIEANVRREVDHP